LYFFWLSKTDKELKCPKLIIQNYEKIENRLTIIRYNFEQFTIQTCKSPVGLSKTDHFI